MASRISQMRNGMYPQTPQQAQQQALNESIERAKNLMNQIKNAANPEAALSNFIQQNPQLGFLSGMLRNGNNLEGIAKQMAQMGGYDINDVLKRLGGN